MIQLRQILTASLFALISSGAGAQVAENWTAKQLMEPSELAEQITANKERPVIFSVGPGSPIPYSIEVGAGKEKENIDRLKKSLTSIPADSQVVIYCGCCPFEHCPNVRPAIEALKEMKFTNYRLLNLSHNIKTDWIDKGYPVTKP